MTSRRILQVKHSLRNQKPYTFERGSLLENAKPQPKDLSIAEQISLYFILVLAFSHVLLSFVGE